jgi:hypothetical protein
VIAAGQHGDRGTGAVAGDEQRLPGLRALVGAPAGPELEAEVIGRIDDLAGCGGRRGEAGDGGDAEPTG